MIDKALEIIKVLYESGDYVTRDVLCERVNIKPRTLRDYLSKYKSYFYNEGGLEVINKMNLGYSLKIIDENKVKDLLKVKTSLLPSEKDERIKYIIKKLLIAKDYLKIDDLSEDLYVSTSTISFDLKEVKIILENHNLYLDSKPGVGLKILGEERYFRGLVREFSFFDLGLKNEGTIRKIILETIGEFDYKLSDRGLENLFVHLLIALQRTHLNKVYEKRQIEVDKEYYISKKIIERINDALNTNLSEEEIYYACLHLRGNRVYDHTDIKTITSETFSLVTRILDEINNKFKVDFKKDRDLYFMLAGHIEPLLYRLKHDLIIKNHLLDKIKQTSSFAYDLALLSSEVIGKHAFKKVNEHEVGFLALYFKLGLEKIQVFTSKRLLLVCASGQGTAKLLLHKLNAIYKDDISYMKTIKYSDLNKTNLQDFDLIVSTIPLEDKFSIPVVTINYLLDDEDISNINNIFYDFDKDEAYLNGFFDQDLVFKNQEFSSKEEAIKFMCDKLDGKYGLPYNFYDLVLEREGLSSTDIGNYIALPHPSNLLLDYSKVVVIHLKKPLFWGRQEVKIIFLLALEKTYNESYKAFEETFFSLINNKNFIYGLYDKFSYKYLIDKMKDSLKNKKDEDIFK